MGWWVGCTTTLIHARGARPGVGAWSVERLPPVVHIWRQLGDRLRILQPQGYNILIINIMLRRSLHHEIRVPSESPSSESDDNDESSAEESNAKNQRSYKENSATEVLCAICALPASNGGKEGDARCEACNEPTGFALICPPAAPLSVPEALRLMLRDALVEASSKVTITGWIDRDEQPECTLQTNLRSLSAAMLRATAQRGTYSSDSEKPSMSQLTAHDVARAVCIGPALASAAGALGGKQLSAPLSRAMRLTLLVVDEANVSATVAASRLATFGAALTRLRDAAAADAPITLQMLCSAVCAPGTLEKIEAALHGEARAEAIALACTNGTWHPAGCDCGAVMGGGFL